MRARSVLVLVCVSGLFAVGCAATGLTYSLTTYLDPHFPKVTHSDIPPITDPRPLHLRVEFQPLGKPNLRASLKALGKTSKILLESKLFSELTLVEDVNRLSIVMSSAADPNELAKGVGMGLTLGLIGESVTNDYLFTATYTPVGKESIKKEYRRTTHTNLGLNKRPEGLQAMSPQEAFDKVLEEFVLSLLRDLRAEGHL